MVWYITAPFKTKRIDKIKRSDVRKQMLRLHKKGLSASTICLTRDVISGVINYAIDEELLEQNCVSGVLKRMDIGRGRNDHHITALTFQESELFLNTCKIHFKPYYPFFLTAFRIGVRLGELLALKWSDIDMNSHFIEVKRSYKHQRISKTKTGKLRRVNMSDQLADALTDLYRQQRKKSLKTQNRESLRGWIFPRKGKPISQNSIRNVFKRILTKAGLQNIRLHDIRHTFASQLLSLGVTPVYVKEQLGHSSIKMTVDIYGHLIPTGNRDMINQLDGVQPNATYTQPENKNAKQAIDLTPHFQKMVPKARLELARTYIH